MALGKISQSISVCRYRRTTVPQEMRFEAAPAAPAGAPAYTPLIYHNGPILPEAKIVPVFWGPFSDDEIQHVVTFLRGLAGYLSGEGASPGKIPVLWQYRCRAASVGNSFTDSSTPPPLPQMQPGATVTALAPREGHVDLFVTGTDGAVWSTWWEAAPGWQNWFFLV